MGVKTTIARLQKSGFLNYERDRAHGFAFSRIVRYSEYKVGHPKVGRSKLVI
jgi:hypothetical protein